MWWINPLIQSGECVAQLHDQVHPTRNGDQQAGKMARHLLLKPAEQSSKRIGTQIGHSVSTGHATRKPI